MYLSRRGQVLDFKFVAIVFQMEQLSHFQMDRYMTTFTDLVIILFDHFAIRFFQERKDEERRARRRTACLVSLFLAKAFPSSRKGFPLSEETHDLFPSYRIFSREKTSFVISIHQEAAKTFVKATSAPAESTHEFSSCCESS